MRRLIAPALLCGGLYAIWRWPLHSAAALGFLSGLFVLLAVTNYGSYHAGRLIQAEEQQKAIVATWKSEANVRASIGIVLAPFDYATRLRILRDVTQAVAVRMAEARIAQESRKLAPLSKGA